MQRRLEGSSTLEECKDGSSCHSKTNYGKELFSTRVDRHEYQIRKSGKRRRLEDATASRRRAGDGVWREGYRRLEADGTWTEIGRKCKDERKRTGGRKGGHPPEPTDTCGRCPGRHLRITLVVPCVKYRPWSACGDIMLYERTRTARCER